MPLRTPTAFVGLLLPAAALTAAALACCAAGATPSLVADINPAGYDSEVQSVGVFQGKIVFGADDPTEGSGYVDVLSYAPGAGHTFEASTYVLPDELPELFFCEFNATLFLAFVDGSAGAGLGMLDSRSTEISLVTRFGNPAGSPPAFMTVFGDRMFLSAIGSEAQGRELWAVDSDLSPSLVHNFSTSNMLGGDPKYLVVFNNKLYMQAHSQDLDKGVELFAYDGDSVALAADINPGSSSSNASHMAVANVVLYMSADGGNGKGQELYAFDGTNAPTMVADINPGAGGSNPEWLIEFQGVLYLSATSPDTGKELFRFDGTTVTLVSDTVTGPGDGSFGKMAAVGGVLYMAASSISTGWELFRLAAAGDAIELAHEVNSRGYASYPTEFTALDGQLYFFADDGVHGKELWRYNSTNGVELAADIMTGPEGSDASNLLSVNGSLVFSGALPGIGVELLQFVPQTAAVNLLADVLEGSESSSPDQLCALGDSLYFYASDGTNKKPMHRFSAAAGASVVEAFPLLAMELTVLGGEIFFPFQHYASGKELWSYSEDAGAALKMDLMNGRGTSQVDSLLAAYGKLYMMAATNPYKDREKNLCRYDPSTHRLKVFELPELSSFKLLVPYQGSILLQASQGNHERFFSLQSDGAAAVVGELEGDLGPISTIILFDGFFFFAPRFLVDVSNPFAHPVGNGVSDAYSIPIADSFANEQLQPHTNGLSDAHTNTLSHEQLNAHANTFRHRQPVVFTKPAGWHNRQLGRWRRRNPGQ
ncbi:hypothetical protein FNF27_03301 [Cafeteria roenbergensis]|uniref:Uncharacterized protein n=1 Tax=Cafeteria roenbergensis TaxID=33653 RepID=A0A5A8EBK8_CAFRO|nr:hypothetical protein FNF27_03301 [Cafeteria roenbergensis]